MVKSKAFADLTYEDRMSGLDRALEARRERARFKELIKSEQLSAALAYSKVSGNKSLERMKTLDFVQCFNGYGPKRACRLLERVGIAKSRRLGGLTLKQAARLCLAIDDHIFD